MDEEMEMQDRDSEQFSAEVPSPTGSQCMWQCIETQEATPCNARDVQGQDSEPQLSTSRGIQEPACKKSKMGMRTSSILPHAMTVPVKRVICQKQTAEEGEPSEDSVSLSTPDVPDVYLESVQSWQRNVQHYRAIEYYERYRFVNMEHVCSLTQAIDVICNKIQRFLNCISREIRANDF
ncbi:hypothetical protein E2320_019685, partial [Naja naja]